VHLTHSAYTRIALAIEKEAEGLREHEEAESKRPKGSGRPINYWRGFVIHEGVGSIGALQWPAPKNIGQDKVSNRGGGHGRGGRGGCGGR
jgi:hypothetical protein